MAAAMVKIEHKKLITFDFKTQLKRAGTWKWNRITNGCVCAFIKTNVILYNSLQPFW